MFLKIAKGIAIASGLFVGFSALSLILSFLMLILVTGLAAALFVSPLLVFACMLIGGGAIWSIVVTLMIVRGGE